MAIIAVSFLIFCGLGYSMMGQWMWWGGGGYWLMPLIMLLFLGVVAAGLYFLLKAFMPGGGAAFREDQDRALAIAKERLARGEITFEEYEKIRKTLTE